MRKRIKNERLFYVFIGVSCLTIALFLGLVLIELSYFTGKVVSYSNLSTRTASMAALPPSPSEAIVVLTGERGRIPKAIALLRQRKSAWLIISGTAPGISLETILNSQRGSGTNAQEIWKRIILESTSTSTMENASHTAKLLTEHHLSRVILVTSELHMLRSIELFRHFSPKTEFFAYPVAGAFSEVRDGSLSALPTAVTKFTIEFTKYFLLRHYWRI